MTTATRRLRRTGVAGFAAAVTAGAVLIGTATSAFAAFGTVTNQVDTTNGATTVFPGTTAAVAIGQDDLNLTNAFNIGDTLTVSLNKAPGCGTTAGAVGFAATPTVTASGPTAGTFGSGAASADASSTVLPKFTVATQSSAGACTTAGIKDQLLITFINSATGVATDNFELTIGNQTVNVGSAVTTGAVTESTVANTTAVATPPTVATVADTKVATTEVSAAPSSAAVALSPIAITEVTAGAAFGTGAESFTLTLAPATEHFTGAVTPTITVPAGYTATNPVTVAGSNVYTFTVTGPATLVAATVTVSGLEVDVAGTTGIVTLTAARVAAVGPPVVAAKTLGSVQNVIGVLNQSRIGGTDRYATAAQLFGAGGFAGGFNKVAVIASGANYPDALSANYLAAGLNGGSGTRVLLTDPNVLPQPTAQALITGGITTVYVVGGTAAVSTNVSNAIAAMHVANNNANAFINVIRVAGADRYATNNQVDLFNGATVGVNTAIVAVGSNFADALSVSPVVVAKKFPLVLTNGPSLSAAAQSTLVNLGIKNVVIAGGTSAVSAATEASIKALGITIAYRLAGADRTVTAQDVAMWETATTATAAFPATATYAALNGLQFSTATVDVARGDGFADALAAGTVAGAVVTTAGPPAAPAQPVVSNAFPILLTGDPNTLGAGIPGYLGGKATTLGTVTVLGLTSAVSVATANAVIASIS